MLNVVSKALACVGLVAVTVAGLAMPAQASPRPVSAISTASAPSSTPVQSITPVKWPTLAHGEAGEMRLRIKPQRGGAFPTAAGVSLRIDAPTGAVFHNGTIVLEDPMSAQKETLTGTLDATRTTLTVTSEKARSSSSYGLRASFNLVAMNPTDGAQWGEFHITGGGAFAPTSSYYHYVGVAPEAVDPTEDQVVITSPIEGEAVHRISPTFTGTGAAGATVALALQDDENTPIGETTVDENGQWSLQNRNFVLDNGLYQVMATQTHNDRTSTSTVDFIVDVTPLTISSPALDGRVGPLPAFSGTGLAGHSIHVIVFNKKTGEQITLDAAVDADNRWSVTPTVALVEGEYGARAVDPQLASAELGNNFVVRSFHVTSSAD